MPPKIPVSLEAYLNMRSLGSAAIMHRTDSRGPAYFSGQDRPFARVRQERREGEGGNAGHLATGTAVILFPIGTPGRAPARWLLFVSAGERSNDPRATKLTPLHPLTTEGGKVVGTAKSHGPGRPADRLQGASARSPPGNT